MNVSKIKHAVVPLLLLTHFLLGAVTISRLSPTYDEPPHIASGFAYWKMGEYRLNILDHPPFAKMFAAVPLLFMKPVLPVHHPSYANRQQYSFGNLFLYHNRLDAEKILSAGRIMILILSCLLGLAVFIWAQGIGGYAAGLVSLVLYVFSSNFIGHGTLVTTDVPLALFYFLSVYCLWRWFRNPTVARTVLCGVAAGFALGSKFSGVIISPVFIVLLILNPSQIKIKFSGLIFHIFVFFCSVFFVMLLLYRGNSIGLYLDGIEYLSGYMKRGWSTFMAGRHSLSGWRHYFAVTFLLKTPVGLLALLGLSAVFFRKAAREEKIFLLIPPLVFFAVASFSRIQIGHRHILPVYPFLFVWTGYSIKNLYDRKSRLVVSTASAILLLWYIFSCMSAHPWHLGYFNEIAGGPANGYKFLTDSNVDWGQGLKELGIWYKKNNPSVIYFSYFGTGDPHYYGIRYVPVGFVTHVPDEERQGDDIVPGGSERIFFAVSATNLQATYYSDREVFSFLKGIPPATLPANSIFVYDLTKNPDALRKLADIFGGFGNVKQMKYLEMRIKGLKRIGGK